MISAPENLNSLHDLTTLLSGMVCQLILGLALAMINLPTKFQVSISTHYEDIKGDRKCRKWGGLG